MKTKENVEIKPVTFDKALQESKPKSLRPMRSLVATRSFKPKTAVAKMVMRTEEVERRP